VRQNDPKISSLQNKIDSAITYWVAMLFCIHKFISASQQPYQIVCIITPDLLMCKLKLTNVPRLSTLSSRAWIQICAVWLWSPYTKTLCYQAWGSYLEKESNFYFENVGLEANETEICGAFCYRYREISE
jgi:hypothetical protein